LPPDHAFDVASFFLHLPSGRAWVNLFFYYNGDSNPKQVSLLLPVVS
jgi:hypothetical protein